MCKIFTALDITIKRLKINLNARNNIIKHMVLEGFRRLCLLTKTVDQLLSI